MERRPAASPTQGDDDDDASKRRADKIWSRSFRPTKRQPARSFFFFSLLLLLLAWVKASAFVRRAASTHAQWHGTGPGREGGGGLSLPGLSILGPGRPRGYSLSQSQEWSPSCQPVHPSIGGVTRYVCAMQTVSEIFSMPVGCVPSKLLLSARQACTRVNNMHGVTPSYFA